MTFNPAVASPAGFARYVSAGAWKPAKHLLLLNRVLMAAAAGEKWASRIIIEMPPRHGKSEFVSGYFPAWYLGMFPDRKVILTTFEDTYAQSWGEKNRDILQQHGPGLFGIRVRGDSHAKGRWALQRRRGMMHSVGIGGALTGKGANLAIIDDPVKNDIQALSETYRERNKNWYRSTLRTRMESPDVIIVIQTRWHQDDLAGWLQKESGEEWLTISLPAIAETDEAIYLPDDPETPAWTRRAGEALWPEVRPLEGLKASRSAMGGKDAYWWLAMYQQRPTSLGGGILKPSQFRKYRRVDGGYLLDSPAGPRLVSTGSLAKFGTMDLAASVKTSADYTVVSVFGVSGADLLVLDVIRNRWEGPDLPNVAAQVHSAYGTAYIGVEQAGFQLSTVQDMRRGDRHADPPRPPLPIRALRPQGDKVTRALTLAARIGGGHVYVPETAVWLPGLEAEMAEFPKGKHDDQVDTLAYAALEQMAWGDNAVVGG